MASKADHRTPPDRANDLFDKLLATSDNAVKTRERVFSDLKEELELLATLQEQHLFPILRKHGMHDLVRQATRDNEETGALLAELERMPKNSGDFIDRVAALRKVFQQHIRDDRKELLPAVLKVLSDEEAEAVAEQVEDEMATIEDMRRNEARRSQYEGVSMQQVAEGMAESVRAAAEGFQIVTRTMQEAVESSFDAASELARLSTGQAVGSFGRPEEQVQEMAEQTSHNPEAVGSSASLVRGIEDVTRECLELSRKRLQANLDGLNQLAQCRSLTDLLAVQSSLMRENLEQTLDNSRRLAELTLQMTGEATRTVTIQTRAATQRTSSGT